MMYNNTTQNKLNRYGKKGIILFIPLFLLLFGSLLFCFAGWKWIGSTGLISQVLVQNKEITQETIENPLEVKIGDRTVMIPQIGEEIGKIKFPTLTKEFPMFYGWRDSALSKGVGLDNRWIGAPQQIDDAGLEYTLSLPGNGGHVVVAGHRDTVFRGLDGLVEGSEIVLDVPYGTFTYSVVSHEIVESDNLDVLDKRDSEVLTVYTCYPFWFIGNAPQRYIIEANLKEAVFKDEAK